MSSPDDLHGIPTAGQLLEAVREFIERDVMAATEGRVRFHARVAVNVLGMVERQLDVGPAQAEAHAERLAALGFEDEAGLAAAIRGGAMDDRYEEVRSAVAETVRDRLLVANPSYPADSTSE